MPIDKIEAALSRFFGKKFFLSSEREVASSLIGELVMDELRQLDEVAYVRLRRCIAALMILKNSAA